MTVLRWSVEEASEAVASPELDRRVGVAMGIAAVAVDLGSDSGADIAALLTKLPVVAIGVGPNADSRWDITTTDPEPALAGVTATPIAAVTVTQVLRESETRSVAEGFLIESLAYATLQSGAEFDAWLGARVAKEEGDDAPRITIVERDDSIDVVMTRPQQHNSLDARMRDELVEAFRTIILRPATPVRLLGQGPSFCAGGDLAEFGTVSDPATAHSLRSSANIAPWLHQIAPRTTAMVHGACIGAGVELAAFCAAVVADPETRFRLPETQMGLMPGAGGTVSIPARIGRRRTLEWLLSGTEIDASTALEWGLVDRISERQPNTNGPEGP